jgi:hypothetical protein
VELDGVRGVRGVRGVLAGRGSSSSSVPELRGLLSCDRVGSEVLLGTDKDRWRRSWYRDLRR